ncbi:MAG TPA: hypothetical protein VIG26_04520 [Methyloceanibacter sp.]
MKRNLWYINSLQRIGLTVPQGAHFFGVDERTNWRWASGERSVPRAVELVFWLMTKQGLKATDIPQPSSDVEFYNSHRLDNRRLDRLTACRR